MPYPLGSSTDTILCTKVTLYNKMNTPYKRSSCFACANGSEHPTLCDQKKYEEVSLLKRDGVPNSQWQYSREELLADGWTEEQINKQCQ